MDGSKVTFSDPKPTAKLLENTNESDTTSKQTNSLKDFIIPIDSSTDIHASELDSPGITVLKDIIEKKQKRLNARQNMRLINSLNPMFDSVSLLTNLAHFVFDFVPVMFEGIIEEIIEEESLIDVMEESLRCVGEMIERDIEKIG